MIDKTINEIAADAERAGGSAAKVMAGFVVGWALRQTARGACYALGGYAALRIIGAL